MGGLLLGAAVVGLPCGSSVVGLLLGLLVGPTMVGQLLGTVVVGRPLQTICPGGSDWHLSDYPSAISGGFGATANGLPLGLPVGSTVV